MYFRQHKTSGKSASDSVATNQLAPRPFKIESPPAQDVVQAESLDSEKQESLPEPTYRHVTPSSPNEAQRKPVTTWKQLNFNPSYQQPSNIQAVQPPVEQSLILQPKLTIGEPGDKYEQEAERTAKDILQRINTTDNDVQRSPSELSMVKANTGLPRVTVFPPGYQPSPPPRVQMKLSIRQPGEEPEPTLDQQINTPVQPLIQRVNVSGMAASPDVEAGIQRARGGGQPLADSIREPMEQAFGADFSGVRVHTDSQANQLNQSIQAKAFTTGQDVFFRQGAYEPGSRGGQELLAHELTHVVQQNDVFDSSSNHPHKTIETEQRLATKPMLKHQFSIDGIKKGFQENFIQRKVGFEFETSITLKAGGEQVIAKNQNIYDSKDWYITPDSSTIEFVTKAFEEEGKFPEVERLVNAIKGINNFLEYLWKLNAEKQPEEEPKEAQNEIIAATPTNDILEDFFGLEAESDSKQVKLYLNEIPPGTAKKFNDNDIYVEQCSDSEIKDKSLAAPQATGGVSLDRIVSLLVHSIKTQLPIKSLYNGDKREEFENTPIGGVDYKRDSKILTDSLKFSESYIQNIAKEKGTVDDVEFDKLKGLVSLIYIYLLAGNVQTKVHDQAKFFLPLMTRMSFTAMYKSLNAITQEYFEPSLILKLCKLDPDEYVYSKGFIDYKDKEQKLRTTSQTFLENEIKPRLESSEAILDLEEDYPNTVSRINTLSITLDNVEDEIKKDFLLEAIEKDLKNKGFQVNPEKGPKRLAWLQSIQNNADAMSKEGSTKVTTGMYASSPAMGQYTELDKNSIGDEITRIELRRLAKSLPPDEWLPVALDIFKMFMLVQQK